MELTLNGIKNREAFSKAEIGLPEYDVEAVRRNTEVSPRWVHFGIGNIFRIFIGGIADRLLTNGEMSTGISAVETFDFDVVDKIYKPFDNLSLSVILHGDGRVDRQVLGSISEALKANDSVDRERLQHIFTSPSLQLVSFTITEKGYALKNAGGEYFGYVKSDLEKGPAGCVSAVAIVAELLYARYRAGELPIALVSMDNVSQNGSLLRKAVLTVVSEWKARGFVPEAFEAYVSDESRVAFPWTMIDKITPRPAEKIAADLEARGLLKMQPVITEKRTYIAPFVNAEEPQYLVVEDNFPNGRPGLEKAGVYMTDRDTVNKSERMKVTVCLNPIHSALGPYGVVLGYDLFSDEMKDPDMLMLGRLVGYGEGMPVVPDPVILSPKAFIDECMNERFPNPYLGDTCLRLSTDVSQGLGVRFGVTVRSYVERDGNAASLLGIPLAIAGWLRYMMGVSDAGNRYELAPDPMNEEVSKALSSIEFGHPETVTDQLKPLLSNENVFFINLYEAGIGEKIEAIFREEIAGPGAVRKTLQKYLA